MFNVDPIETLVHDEITFKFNRNLNRIVTIVMSDSSIEQVYEKAIKMGYKPIKWYQFWRSRSNMYIIHNQNVLVWKCNR